MEVKAALPAPSLNCNPNTDLSMWKPCSSLWHLDSHLGGRVKCKGEGEKAVSHNLFLYWKVNIQTSKQAVRKETQFLIQRDIQKLTADPFKTGGLYPVENSTKAGFGCTSLALTSRRPHTVKVLTSSLLWDTKFLEGRTHVSFISYLSQCRAQWIAQTALCWMIEWFIMEEGYSHRLSKRSLILPYSICALLQSQINLNNTHFWVCPICIQSFPGFPSKHTVHCQWLIWMPNLPCQSCLTHPPLNTLCFLPSICTIPWFPNTLRASPI